MDTQALPILAIRSPLLNALPRCRRFIITAPTGSGKSTQVPQYLLDSGCLQGQCLVLQPRRLAARLLAERICDERGTVLGEETGFQTRFEHVVSATTRLRFITEGILPRLLLTDPRLSGIGAVIFDEFHERSLAVDLSLALVRQVQERARPDLNLIVMSATLAAAELAAYLPGAERLHAEGRLHPVNVRYAARASRDPVWEQAATAVADLVHAEPSGDILVFMPGAFEIRRTVEACRRRLSSQQVTLFSLYGELPGEQQRAALAPGAQRKVIVATNIAETSLTIPGVRHVVDSGLARIHRYDPARGFNTLFVEPISRASADQRAGRAGREGPGVCVRLWPQLEQNHRYPYSDPEIRRVDLAEALLHIRLLGFPEPATFPWYEPPLPDAVAAADALLTELGAVVDGAASPLGREIAALPLHPRLGRFLIEAAQRGCLRDACLTAAILSERTALTAERAAAAAEAGPDTNDAASDFQKLFAGLHAAQHAHFDEESCARLGIHAGAARQVLRTDAFFVQVCRRRGLPFAQGTGTHDDLLKALLLAYPDHLARRRDQGTWQCELRNGRRGELARHSAVRHAALLVATDIREQAVKGQGARTTLSLAGEVREEWLHELFPEQWHSEATLVWNDASRQVEELTRRSCLGVLMDERTRDPSDIGAASALLARRIGERRLPLQGWDDAVDAWIDRVRWVAAQRPEHTLVTFDEHDRELIVAELCAGEWKYSRVKDKPVLPVVRSTLSYEDQRFVDRIAPEFYELPNGRRMRVRYSLGRPPRGNARIQELYGLPETPVVGESRVRLLLEILGPNMRPVQITDDLAGFWRNHYPGVKKTLARRYPKHEWR